MSASLLVVEDDPDISELIRHTMVQEGFRCAAAADGEKGLALAQKQKPDVVLLDVMLPGLDGLQVLKALKRDPKTSTIPVILVSAKGSEADVVLGLELGAEDYVVKPFSPRVLAARVKAALRRREPASPEGSGPIRIRPDRHEVTVSGRPVALTLTEFRILECLARRPGQVFTRNQLLDSARGADVVVLDRTVDVHLSSLRRKLGKAGDLVETVRGVGYRLKD